MARLLSLLLPLAGASYHSAATRGSRSASALHLPGRGPSCARPIAMLAAKDDDKSPGTLLDEALAVDLTPNQETSEFVRDPPPYPDGLHEPAKADRDGPFWSSLGEPDASTGVRPPYLRRDDWHVSSTYSSDKRSAVKEEEDNFIESVRIELPEDEDEVEDDPESWLKENYGQDREYMQREAPLKGDPIAPSELAMPNTWQDYQDLQERIGQLASSETVPEVEREMARRHEANLADFYLQFKDIISESMGGWKLENSPYIENAMKYAREHEGK